jgi:hypothetical protein
MPVPQQVIDDLQFALSYFPLRSLIHVRANRDRLIRSAYRRGEKGCLFNLLSEVLPINQQINSRQNLMQFFTGMRDLDASQIAEYQPARWLVRLVDGQDCGGRYGSYVRLRWMDLTKFLDREIARRIGIELQAARVRRGVLRRLSARSTPAGEP